jgi:chromosome partitioning protein
MRIRRRDKELSPQTLPTPNRAPNGASAAFESPAHPTAADPVRTIITESPPVAEPIPPEPVPAPVQAPGPEREPEAAVPATPPSTPPPPVEAASPVAVNNLALPDTAVSHPAATTSEPEPEREKEPEPVALAPPESTTEREPEPEVAPAPEESITEYEPATEAAPVREPEVAPAPEPEAAVAPNGPATSSAVETETETEKPEKFEKSKKSKTEKKSKAGQSVEHQMKPPSIGPEADALLDGARPPARDLPRVIAVANQKGGVGKTTTTVNLGAALAEEGYRVLVVDLDPQGNATTGLGIDARNFELSMYDVIMRDQPLEDCIEPTSVKNLFVAPATIDLAGIEIELVPAFSRELKLKRAIDSVVDDFDFILIDCPPSLGLITVNGLAAAGEVLVPIQCEYYALEGLSQLLRNVNLVSTNLNESLEVTTIVLTMFDARTRLSIDVANEVREHFSDRVCRSVIPRTVRLSEAPSFGQPITVFDPSSRGAVAYRELAKEVSNGAPQRTR